MDTMKDILVKETEKAMSFSEWLDLATAVILLFTLIAVFWYTVETRRLRRVASKQLAIQLGAIQPLLKSWGGSRSDERIVVYMENVGGPAYDVKPSPHGEFFMWTEPEGRVLGWSGDAIHFIATGDRFQFIIQGKNVGSAVKLTFDLKFMDGVGDKHTLLGTYKIGGEVVFERKGT